MITTDVDDYHDRGELMYKITVVISSGHFSKRNMHWIEQYEVFNVYPNIIFSKIDNTHAN